MERAWIIVSVLCLMAAVLFWALRDNLDATFVAAALGAVAWFLSLRNRLRRSVIEHDDTNFDHESDTDQDED
ncbi:MAG: hypothetical protein ABR577_12930 [Pyrinomonadaceae bacterium]